MTTYFDIRAEDLPERIRADLPKGAVVNVTVDVSNGSLPGYSEEQLDDMLSVTDEDIASGTQLHSRAEIRAHLDTLVDSVSTRHAREEELLRKLG